MNALQAEVLGYAGPDEEIFKLRYMLLVARPFLVGVNNKEHEWLAFGVLTEVPVTIVAIALVKGFLLKGLGGLCDVVGRQTRPRPYSQELATTLVA